MKKSTLIAGIFVIAALISLYFVMNYRNRPEISITGTNCENPVSEVYVLIMNPGDNDLLGDVTLTITDKETKKSSKVKQPMRRTLEAKRFRQDTVFVPAEYNFDCENYNIEAKIKK